MLDAGWITRHHDRADVLHVHFGTESYDTDHVRRALVAAREHGWGVVHTVHDLDHPQVLDQARHRATVRALVAGSDEVLTLTPGAARAVSDLTGREARVLPHPTLRDLDTAAPTGSPGLRPVIGVHLRDLRPNIDALGTTRLLAAVLPVLHGEGSRAQVRLFVNTRVRRPEVLDALAPVLADHPAIELVRRPRPDDDALERELADLDVSVLPYAHGTHSGWVESCHDLAVPVVGPQVGWWHEQHPDDVHGHRRDDPASALIALRAALAVPHGRPGSTARVREVATRAGRRRAERDQVRAEHTRLYQRVGSRRGPR